MNEKSEEQESFFTYFFLSQKCLNTWKTMVPWWPKLPIGWTQAGNCLFTFSLTNSSHTISKKVWEFTAWRPKKLNCFFAGWMAKTFFTGGTMPSHDLLLHFQEDLQIVQRWVVNGQHYSKTLEAWLKKLDANIKQIWPILETTYGNSLSSELFGSAFFTILSRVAFFCYSE